MASYKTTLKNKNQDTLYPQTKADIVLANNDTTNVQAVLDSYGTRLSNVETVASKYKGYYTSASQLPNPVSPETGQGWYAYVDQGSEKPAKMYIYDTSDHEWVMTDTNVEGIEVINGKSGQSVTLDATDIDATVDNVTDTIQNHLSTLNSDISSLGNEVDTKADIVDTVTDVTYDGSSKKLKKTKNSVTSDIVTFGDNAFNSTPIPTSYVSSVNGATGDISNIATLSDIPSIPTDVSSFNNDAGYLTTSTGVTSVNGNHGDITDIATLSDIPTIPTNVSDFTNDAGYITSSDVNYPVTDVEVNGTSVLDGTVAKVTVPTKVSDLQNDAEYITGIDSSDVTTALGYTPVDSASLGTASAKDYTSSVDDSNDLPTSTAVRQFVNSSIATNTANFLGTYNIVTDLGLTTSATEQQIASAIATALSGETVTNNDYVFVAYPDATVSTEYTKFDRWKASVSNNVATWNYEYTLNNSTFTSQQWASINSGITGTDVTQIGTNTTNISNLNTNKQDKITSTNKLDYSLLTNTPTIPTDTSDLTNNAGFITSSSLDSYLPLSAGSNNKLTGPLYVAESTRDEGVNTSNKGIQFASGSTIRARINGGETGILGLYATDGIDGIYFGANGVKASLNATCFKPITSNTVLDLGTSSNKFKDLYLSGNLSDGTNSISIANIANVNNVPTTGTSAGDVPVLDNNGKLATSVIPDVVMGQMEYKGTFDASTGSTLTGLEKGWYYVCSVAGSKNPDGTTASYTYAIGDWAVYNGTSWDKIDNTDAVSSVNGQTGAVQLTASDVGALPSNTSFVSDITYDSTNKKIQKTIGSTTSDVVTFGSNAFNSTTIPTNTNQLTNGAGFITSNDLPTSINGLGGGQLTSPLVIKGGDAATASKITLDQTASGQITNNSTSTLFGFTSNNATTLTVGHSSYALALRGSGTRPKFNSNDVAMYSDIPSVPTVNNPTITITQGGVTKGSFSLNQASGDTIALDAGGGSSITSVDGLSGGTITSATNVKGTLSVLNSSNTSACSIDQNGDVTGRYLQGTWLKSTSATDLSGWTSAWVDDGNGWLYKRAKSSLKSDLDVPTTYLSSSNYNSSNKTLTITPNSGTATTVTFGSNAFTSTSIPTMAGGSGTYYAPTSTGTDGQFLKSSGGAVPTWETLFAFTNTSGSGYITFNNGFKIKWGKATPSSGTFNISFSSYGGNFSSGYAIVCMSTSATTTNTVVAAKATATSNSSATIYVPYRSSGSGIGWATEQCSWIAIGS